VLLHCGVGAGLVPALLEGNRKGRPYKQRILSRVSLTLNPGYGPATFGKTPGTASK